MSKSLIIDPGHGGVDPGANGFGVNEKDWTLKISLYQYNRLKELGAKVGITRTTDKTLDSGPRTDLIRNKYDYCMSNHWNAFNGNARGVEAIHSAYSSDEIASRIANVVVMASNLPFRRVFSKKNSSGGDYYFIQRLTGNTSSIHIEYGFIDNKKDNDFYKNEDNFYKVAEVVVKEWCAILGVKYVAPKGRGEKLSNEPSKWAKAVWDKQVKQGYFDGRNPQGPITREQGAALIERVVNNIRKYEIDPLAKRVEELENKK